MVSGWRLALVALLALICAACNLERRTPIPIPTAAPLATATRILPTAIPSITPLPGVNAPPGGGVSVPNCPQPSGWVTYVVRTGDSLGALAANTGTTVAALAQANCLDNPDSLFAGQTIYLPRVPISGG
jgi:spore germination protein YaaH